MCVWAADEDDRRTKVRQKRRARAIVMRAEKSNRRAKRKRIEQEVSALSPKARRKELKTLSTGYLEDARQRGVTLLHVTKIVQLDSHAYRRDLEGDATTEEDE